MDELNPNVARHCQERHDGSVGRGHRTVGEHGSEFDETFNLHRHVFGGQREMFQAQRLMRAAFRQFLSGHGVGDHDEGRTVAAQRATYDPVAARPLR